MSRYFVSTIAILITIAVLDAIWLGVVAKPLYASGIGHLFAAKPNFVAAVAFYLIFSAGLTVFAVMPSETALGFGGTALRAALFGFVCYATYDLSNLATLKDWPVSLSVIDMLWGSALSSAAATVGKAVLDRMRTAA